MFKYCTITSYTLMNSVNPTKIYCLEKPHNKKRFSFTGKCYVIVCIIGSFHRIEFLFIELSKLTVILRLMMMTIKIKRLKIRI